MDKSSKKQPTGKRRLVTRNFLDGTGEIIDDSAARVEENRDEACATLSRTFNEVQRYLDHNWRLIEQVNNNHRSKIPSNIARNPALIRQINHNIARITALYATMSSNFTGIVNRNKGESSSSKG